MRYFCQKCRHQFFWKTAIVDALREDIMTSHAGDQIELILTCGQCGNLDRYGLLIPRPEVAR